MLRTCSSLLLALLALLLAAGCGGDERVEYEQGLADVGTQVSRSLDKLPRNDTKQVGGAEIATLAKDVEHAANELEDLDPPENVRGAHRQLEQGLRSVARAYEQLAGDLDAAETREQQAAVFVEFATDDDIDAAFDDIVTAQESFDAAGYRVFGAPAVRPSAPPKPASTKPPSA